MLGRCLHYVSIIWDFYTTLGYHDNQICRCASNDNCKILIVIFAAQLYIHIVNTMNIVATLFHYAVPICLQVNTTEYTVCVSRKVID